MVLLKITELHQFNKVRGTVCLTMVLPKNVEIHPVETEDDLKKVLTDLLHGVEKGTYPFLVLSLAPLAYGKIVKERNGKTT